jgi:hypothetical protein
VLNAVGKALAAEVGEEDLYGLLIFARQDNGNHFSGDIRFYGYGSGEGDIKIRASTNIEDPDPDLNFEYSVLANQVGLSRLWRQMSSNPQDEQGTRAGFRADLRTSQDIARAIITLDRQTGTPPRP